MKADGFTGPSAFLFKKCLLAQAELSDDGAVTLDVLLLEIGKEVTTATDHLQEATTAVVVLLVGLEVLVEVVDAVGEQCDLYLGRTGVGLVEAMGFDYFVLCFKHVFGFLSPYVICRFLQVGATVNAEQR